MSDLRKAAEMALEALNLVMSHGQAVQRAKDVLRQTLAQPEWVGLSDEEAWGVYRTHGLSFHKPNHVEEYEWALCMRDFARAIEAKLKEKNT